ncbi:unnamed protein product [Dovyalis caffra]|uniref:Uncharacterized protein n=1 Tax=Dovyalis caffra TaxID=77055 RepID=A0AAV1SNA5_9ROSI|nr:unnamed protein product [Dovyalis caffra]
MAKKHKRSLLVVPINSINKMDPNQWNALKVPSTDLVGVMELITEKYLVVLSISYGKWAAFDGVAKSNSEDHYDILATRVERVGYIKMDVIGLAFL